MDGEDRSPRVDVVETWSPPRFASRHAQTVRVLGAALILALLVAPFAVAGPPARTASPAQQNFTQPVKITAKAAADYLLKVRNTATPGLGARVICTSPGDPCLYVTNTDGPAAKFRSGAGQPPFEIGPGAAKVPNLDADRVDGQSADQIVDRAIAQGAGSRAPSGPAGGSLAGTYPNPAIAPGAVTDTEVAAANKDGAAATPSLRTLGSNPGQAAAGNDPRLSNARTPTGATGGDLTGTYPDPNLAADSIDSTSLFTSGLKDGATGSPTLRSLGTGASQAAAGDDPRLSNARTPTGAAGGDLAGTYPDPTLASNSIDSTSLFTSGLQDGAAATPTLRSLGTGASQAAAGNDARLSNARTPTGAAGGDLTGTYPNPTLASNSIDSVALFTAGLQDGAAATPTLRSLGTGAAQAAAGNDTRIPTQGENDALQGTDGTPGGANRYVTDSDARNTNARAPTNGSVTTAKFAVLPHARAINSVAQSFVNGSIVIVQLNAESFGSDVSFDDANDRLIILTEGTYLLTGEVVWAQNGTGTRFMGINSTNQGELVADARTAVGGTNTVNEVSTVAQLDVGDSVSLDAGQDSGGALSTDASLGRGAALTATWLGPKAP